MPVHNREQAAAVDTEAHQLVWTVPAHKLREERSQAEQRHAPVQSCDRVQLDLETLTAALQVHARQICDLARRWNLPTSPRCLSHDMTSSPNAPTTSESARVAPTCAIRRSTLGRYCSPR